MYARAYIYKKKKSIDLRIGAAGELVEGVTQPTCQGQLRPGPTAAACHPRTKLDMQSPLARQQYTLDPVYSRHFFRPHGIKSETSVACNFS